MWEWPTNVSRFPYIRPVLTDCRPYPTVHFRLTAQSPGRLLFGIFSFSIIGQKGMERSALIVGWKD